MGPRAGLDGCRNFLPFITNIVIPPGKLSGENRLLWRNCGMFNGDIIRSLIISDYLSTVE